ncbi:acyltransferase family protein [Corynebacterium sphenisci]|uniref:acyltransferase family protein n=1 Tax=Corynebacterium sphenisci TaxID=191493 RepID=UPI0026E085E5|nr:acyltransferase family protein [Corynebacterium sphenisci]MDO5731865.1 acyltransferase family protein [Corynebacterium sphenisci]
MPSTRGVDRCPAGAPAAAPRRPDLDGLRGVAIALVVVFHVYVGRVSGGVDVFLLLSGFFFIGALIRAADRPGTSLNPWWPLWRTLRRLYPALVAVTASCAALVLLAVPRLRTVELAEQLFASLLYLENVKLARTAAGYGAAARGISPLQHLWSMSVQFHAYLLAIAVVAALGRRARRRRAAAGAVARAALPALLAGVAASFAYACWLHDRDQVANYYSTIARFWEIGLGAVLALLLTRHDGRRRALPDRAAGALAATGLLLIALTGAVLDGAAEFPGPGTLLPLGGAALVILAGGRPGAATALLESRPALFLGRIAYPLYLWHWPLLIITIDLLGSRRPGAIPGTAVIAASLLLAQATHRFVEAPLRQRRPRPAAGEPVVAGALAELRRDRPARTRALAGVGVVAVAAVCLSALPYSRAVTARYAAADPDPATHPGGRVLTAGIPEPPGIAPWPPYGVLAEGRSRVGRDGCVVDAFAPPAADAVAAVTAAGGSCVYGDPAGERSMMLVGGSHSQHWFDALDAVARDHGWRLLVRIRQGCPGALGEVPGLDLDCATWNRRLLEDIRAHRPDLVVTVSTRPRPDGPGDYTPPAYRSFFDAVAGLGAGILGIRDNPWGRDRSLAGYAAPGCVESGGDPAGCGPARAVALSVTDPGARALSGYPRSRAVDFSDVFCDAARCPAVLGNMWVYRDDDHLSPAFVRTLTPELDRRIGVFLDGLAAG